MKTFCFRCGESDLHIGNYSDNHITAFGTGLPLSDGEIERVIEMIDRCDPPYRFYTESKQAAFVFRQKEQAVSFIRILTAPADNSPSDGIIEDMKCTRESYEAVLQQMNGIIINQKQLMAECREFYRRSFNFKALSELAAAERRARRENLPNADDLSMILRSFGATEIRPYHGEAFLTSEHLCTSDIPIKSRVIDSVIFSGWKLCFDGRMNEVLLPAEVTVKAITSKKEKKRHGN